ncbi:MFS transporter [Antrihabitans sp. YC2-6]|uniref:MFS transporter n=1 Tax=Antrihabitans sp. YC2-6 TaxID=2799498 RepID=UPI0018F348B7|nr:MFS transporter [Antrihabitans sp. YC2-6]MBJ8344145.1 MFS transporter [Antrihabitans sp. YC2-6]
MTITVGTKGADENVRASRREWIALIALSLAVLLISVDATVLDLALPAISADLQPSSTQLLWVIDVYSFVLAGLLVTMGTLGDRIGRRRLLLWGAAGFGVASAIAAWSVNPEMLIAARVLQGISGATLMPATLGLIRAIFRDSGQRTTAIGVWSAMAGGGAAAGPLIGGWLLEHFWWGSVFLINVPVMIALVAAGPFLIPEHKDSNPGRFDLISAAQSMIAIVPIVYAVKEIAVHGLDAEAVVIGLAGIAVGVLFIRRQRRLADPLLDLDLFANKRFSTAVLTNLMSVFALAGVLFFGSQYLQSVLGKSPLEAGLLMLPGMSASMVTALIAAWLVRRWKTRDVLATGLVVGAIGSGAMVLLQTTSGIAVFMVAFTLVGAGVGIALTLTSDIVVSSVEPARAGAASAVSETAYELGIALGVAVLGSVVLRIFRDGLDLTGLADVHAAAARETLGGAVAVAQSAPAGVHSALLESAHLGFVSGIHIAAIATGLLLVANAVLVMRMLRSK